ncbi:MAG: hypothetical protein ABJ275_02875 [Maricaulaceae bacterium]
MMKRYAITFMAALMVSACATAPGNLPYSDQEYANLPIEHFLELMTLKDDELETSAQFSTYKGRRPNPSGDLYLSFVSNPNDEFMRAHVFKDSGKEIYQMYFLLSSSQWKRPSQINFSAGLGSKPTDRIGIDATCSGASCTNFEDVVVNFTKEELQGVLTALESLSEKAVRFRVKGQSGKDYDGSMASNEIKAILQAVETYKATR